MKSDLLRFVLNPRVENRSIYCVSIQRIFFRIIASYNVKKLYSIRVTSITISRSLARISSDRLYLHPFNESIVTDKRRKTRLIALIAIRAMRTIHYFNRRMNEIIDSSTLHHIVECLILELGTKASVKSWPQDTRGCKYVHT